MRKISAIILAFVLLGVTLLACASAENESAFFVLSDVSGKPGETVNVKLSLECSVDVNSIAFTGIEFDETVLEFIGFEDYEHLSGKAIMPIESFVDNENKTIMVPLATTETYSGDFCTLKFKIKENAAAGSVEISAESVVKNGSETISSSVKSAVVTVTVENERIEYKYGQNVQIGLIEPWFLKANARVYTATSSANIDYNTLVDFGAYFIRSSELADSSATQDTLSFEDIINDADSVKCSKNDGTASTDSGYMTARYDKGLYTFELDDSVFVMFYIEDSTGIHYAPIRERNLKSLCEVRKDDSANFPNDLERAVYENMLNMYEAIKAYRDDYFSKN